MRASSELHLRSVWSFPFDFQSTPPHEDALVYGLSLLMLLSRGTLTPCVIAMPGAIPDRRRRFAALRSGGDGRGLSVRKLSTSVRHRIESFRGDFDKWFVISSC